MSETTTEAAGQPTEPTTEPTAPETAAPEQEQRQETPLTEERLNQLLGGFNREISSRFDAITQRLPEAEQAPEEPEVFMPDYRPDDFDEAGDLRPEAQMRALQEIVNRQVQEALRPQQEAALEARRAQEADALETKYPQLRDAKYQDQILDEAADYAQRIGRPDLIAEPSLVELVHLARVGRERAAAEGPPAGSQQEGVVPERGGAPVAAPPAQEDAGDRIVKLAQQSRFRLGTGGGVRLK